MAYCRIHGYHRRTLWATTAGSNVVAIGEVTRCRGEGRQERSLGHILHVRFLRTTCCGQGGGGGDRLILDRGYSLAKLPCFFEGAKNLVNTRFAHLSFVDFSLLASGPRVPISAPCSPYFHTSNFFIFSVMLARGLRVPISSSSTPATSSSKTSSTEKLQAPGRRKKRTKTRTTIPATRSTATASSAPAAKRKNSSSPSVAAKQRKT